MTTPSNSALSTQHSALPPDGSALLLRAERLTKHFPRRSGMWGDVHDVVRAVEDVSFDIARGETLGLVGESGSGKSTTGRMILRLIEPTAGSCLYNGRDVFQLPKDQMRALRREMQIVFQDPYGAFNPRMTVGHIISEALELRDIKGGKERSAEISRYLEMVQLPTNIHARYPHEFSGGQRQRLSIARALAVNPKFIVADEPVSALDVSTQAEIVNLLLELQSQLDLTMLFISHDLSVVRVLCDRVAVMFAGRILELAHGPALFKNPLQPYTKELLAAVPIPDPQRARKRKEVVEATEEESAAAQSSDAAQPQQSSVQQQGCPYAGRCPYTMEICRQEMPPLVDYGPRLEEETPHWAACHWVEENLNVNITTESTEKSMRVQGSGSRV